MNELITTATMAITDRKFKDERLTKATQRIAAIYSDAVKYADTKNREVASILADIKVKKAYEKDGYKSVAEYASDVFGIARQNAYALASAGEIYNNPKTHPELKKMSPSKLAEVSKLNADNADVLRKALDEGKITAETTQKDLRDFVKAQKPEKEAKPEVLDKYIVAIDGVYPDCIRPYENEFREPAILPDWEEFFKAALDSTGPMRPIEVIKLPKAAPITDIDGKATILRYLYTCDTFSMVVEYTKPLINQAAKKDNAKALDANNVSDVLAFMLANGGEEMVDKYLAEHPEIKVVAK